MKDAAINSPQASAPSPAPDIQRLPFAGALDACRDRQRKTHGTMGVSCGHLLWIVQLCDPHPDLSHRWDYYQRTLEAGKLLRADPWEFEKLSAVTSPMHAQARKNLERWVDRIYQETGSWSALSRALVGMGGGLSALSESPPRAAAVPAPRSMNGSTATSIWARC